ncbi:GntR family transcriptional regulator [Streptomyces sp. NPDC088124]|uniref:GntR family transcriptional regulator n=1 Tax=Streptomyces sp. NPDC088124 TaxID=3154654 RepID=UPI00341571CF
MAQREETTSPTKAEAAFNAIRRRIETGDLPGGAKLTLQALSDELGMSLTPIREALRVLQAHGLVEYKPHHGHIVTRYTLFRASEVYRLRAHLEPLAVELAAQRATEEELREIQDLHDQFAEAAKARGGSNSAVVELNARWHRAIYATARSAFLEDFIDRLWTGMPYQAIWFIHRRQQSCVDHEAVTTALVDRNDALASTAMRLHILRAEQATVEHLRAIGAPEA